jgi:hypothetical protein
MWTELPLIRTALSRNYTFDQGQDIITGYIEVFDAVKYIASFQKK